MSVFTDTRYSFFKGPLIKREKQTLLIMNNIIRIKSLCSFIFSVPTYIPISFQVSHSKETIRLYCTKNLSGEKTSQAQSDWYWWKYFGRLIFKHRHTYLWENALTNNLHARVCLYGPTSPRVTVTLPCKNWHNSTQQTQSISFLYFAWSNWTIVCCKIAWTLKHSSLAYLPSVFVFQHQRHTCS